MTAVAELTDRRIAGHIKTLMGAAGINQTELASRTGIPQYRLSKSLNGPRTLKPAEIELIARALDVEIDRLFRGPKITDVERLLGDRVSACIRGPWGETPRAARHLAAA